MDQARIKYLLQQYFNKRYSASEKEELNALLAAMKDDELVAEELKELWDKYETMHQIPARQSAEYLEAIRARIQMPSTAKARRRPVSRILYWSAAASLLVIFTLAVIYFVTSNKSTPGTNTVVDSFKTTGGQPGTNGATLTLADGSTMVLDSLSSKVIARQGSTEIELHKGNLRYDANAQPNAALLYNRVVTARSQQYAVDLSDGTRVWLNAGSSIYYPVVFGDSNRTVEVTGEVYFEVAHNPKKPFKVKKAGSDISVMVLGTHFNVNFYDDEPSVKVSLLEGSVKVFNGASEAKLAPGQQAQVTRSSGTVAINKHVDLDAVMAWRNGYFSFDKSDLTTVMRQLSRWYNIEVVYEGTPPALQFWGGISRQSSLPQVLEILQESKVQFEIKGNQLIVRSAK